MKLLNLITTLGMVVLYAAAAPTTYLFREAVNERVVVANRPENVKILKQINQLNDDGSYTFGFEAADGSFRKEVRNVLGHVTGRYGYIDANGQLHELEYVSGQLSGKNLGFRVKSAKVPVPVAPPAPVDQKQSAYRYSSGNDNQNGHSEATAKIVQTPTVVRYVEQVPATVQKYVVQQVKSAVVPASVVSVAPAPVDQKTLDFQYSSVDDNEDGQPDAPLSVVRVEEVPAVVQAKQTLVPVAVSQSTTVDQKQLDYQYHSVDDNQDGHPDDAVRLVQTPTVIRYVEQAPVQRYVVQQTKTTPISIVQVDSSQTDQKVLDYQYSSVDDNGDGQPDAPVSVVHLEKAPVVVQAKQTLVPVIVSQSTTVDQKQLDYQYHSVDDNQDGHPDDAVRVVQTPSVTRYVEQAPAQRYVIQQTKTTPVSIVQVDSSQTNQKVLDYQYSSVDDNGDGQPDAPVSVVRLEEAPVVVQTKQTVVPVVVAKTSTSVDQKHLDYEYHSVDDNQDGHPDSAFKVVQTPTVVRYVEQVPVQKYVVAKSPVVPASVVQVASSTVDQKTLDYQYSSVDDNGDGHPDAPAQVIRLEEVPVVLQAKETVVPVVIGKTSTTADQKHLDYQYHSVDDNEDGHPDAPVERVVQATLVQVQPNVVPISIATSSSVDQKALDYKYSSVDDNQDGIPDSAKVLVQNPTIVRYEPTPTVVRVVQTVVRPEIIGQRTVYSNGQVDQFIRDLRYHSVDTDEDGIPDEAIEVSNLPVLVSRIA